ncbi:MAG: phage holin family protein [Caldisericaceae bacterium]
MKSRFIWGLFINSVAFYLVSLVVPGFVFTNTVSIIIAALVLGIANTIIKPIFMLISIPFTILTLGLFIFVVNGIVIEIVAFLSPGFSITSFGTAVLGAFLLSVFSTVLTWLLFPKRVG